jgi:hypothetical protein
MPALRVRLIPPLSLRLSCYRAADPVHVCACVVCSVADFIDPSNGCKVKTPDAGSPAAVSTAHMPFASAQPARNKSFDVPKTGRFTWLTTAQTLEESGLRRWAIQIVQSGGWSFGLGVSNHTPAECAALCAVANGSVVTISKQSCVLVSNSTGDAFHREQALRRPPADFEPFTGSSASDGMVVTFDADTKANALRVQFHKPTAARAPTDKTPHAPSPVMTVDVPDDLPLAKCRPTLALWGPSVVAEVEANGRFPLKQ